jgi:AcrR family transcriptional regulator
MSTSDLSDLARNGNGPEARRLRQREETRQTILDATEALILSSHGDDFSIRALAGVSGYSAPTIYHHFQDKDGLIEALLDARFGRLMEQLRRVELGADPLANLRELARAFVEFGMANPPFYRLISTISRKGQHRMPPSIEQVRELLRQPLQQLQSGGRLSVANLELAELAIWALLHGLANLRINRPQDDWPPDLTRGAIDAMLRGLARADAGETP